MFGLPELKAIENAGVNPHIRAERIADHMMKYHVRGPWPFDIVLHKFTAPDLSEPHDHPYQMRSTILHGGYVEEVYALDGTFTTHTHSKGETFLIPARHIHRIVALLAPEVWTLAMFDDEAPITNRWGQYQFREGQAFKRIWGEPEYLPAPALA